MTQRRATAKETLTAKVIVETATSWRFELDVSDRASSRRQLSALDCTVHDVPKLDHQQVLDQLGPTDEELEGWWGWPSPAQ